MSPDPAPEPHPLAPEADEHALGLLGEAEAAALEARLATDPALARTLGEARDRLLPIDLAAPPAEIPPHLVDRIRAAIRAAVHPAGAAARREPTPAPRARTPAVAAGIGAAAGLGVGFGVGLGFGALRPPPAPLAAAVLVDRDGVPRAVVEAFPDGVTELRFVADVAVPEARTMQLWTVPTPGARPVSLGSVDAPVAARLRAADLPAPVAGQLFEITFEPRGGSPTGAPTGPALARGLAATQDR